MTAVTTPAFQGLHLAGLFLVLAAACGAPSAAQPQPQAGTGQGYHDPRSTVPRLAARTDVVPWELLGQVKATLKDHKIVATFPVAVKALDKQKVKVQGYMLPLEASQSQGQFVLSAVPTSCAFCIPAGPEGLIDVRAKSPVKYTEGPVVLEGRMAVLDGKEGVFYRLLDAVQVP